jgi:Cu2+-exporting ATPase
MPTATADPHTAPATVLDDPVERERCTRAVRGNRGEALLESALQLSGLHCAACAGLIEQALRGVSGVLTAEVSAATERATVRWDPQRTRLSAFIGAVQDAGYGAAPDAAAPARALRRQAHRQALWRLFVAGFCAMQVMMMATPSYVAGAGELPPDLRHLLNWGSWLLSLPVLVFSAAPFFGGAWRALRRRRIAMDLPVALGVAITFVASTGASFEPGGVFGSEVYFDSLTMFVSFLLGARYLELQARHRAAEALESTLAGLPETAWRVREGQPDEAVSTLRLRAGELLRVPVGQAFPADGVVEQGATRADEALLTGESMPVDKPLGATVVAGSLNLGAPVLVRAQRVGADTRLQAIVAMMKDAQSQRPAQAALADRWAAPFLWTVLLLAAGAAAVWSVIDPPRAVWVAVSVLIVTCPCALSLAAPTTLVAAARGLARRGVLVQRLDAIERLAHVQQVFFDKTGTLTEDQPGLSHTLRTPAGQALWTDDAAALAAAATLAVWSAHPLSRALAQAAGGVAPRSEDWTDVTETPGRGLSARDPGGAMWTLGAGSTEDGEARTTLAREGQPLASFTFTEALRPGAAAALQALQAAGLQVWMLSGDARPRALALAARLGLVPAQVLAPATPQDKLDAVSTAQAAGGRVAMVGDGINDAPVLARADVSLAMGQGALVARAQADAVITSGRLLDVVAARRSAVRAVHIVRQNFAWAIAYNLLSLPLAMAGWLPPWAAGLGMACSSLVVVGNALRAAR